MKLEELLKLANKHYPDGQIEYYSDPLNRNKMGDGLAKFIVTELSETFPERETGEYQILAAIRKMQTAEAELSNLIGGLTEELKEVRDRNASYLVLTIYKDTGGNIQFHADGEGCFDRDIDPHDVGEVIRQFWIAGEIKKESKHPDPWPNG